ncbi:MAG: hypothetical protein KW804_01890 [Candidatus Doudnabacteria bacterium]|nr:hypothetical protein [Candidatus Doudnabacteria bacterium]
MSEKISNVSMSGVKLGDNVHFSLNVYPIFMQKKSEIDWENWSVRLLIEQAHGDYKHVVLDFEEATLDPVDMPSFAIVSAELTLSALHQAVEYALNAVAKLEIEGVYDENQPDESKVDFHIKFGNYLARSTMLNRDLLGLVEVTEPPRELSKLNILDWIDLEIMGIEESAEDESRAVQIEHLRDIRRLYDEQNDVGRLVELLEKAQADAERSLYTLDRHGILDNASVAKFGTEATKITKDIIRGEIDTIKEFLEFLRG